MILGKCFEAWLMFNKRVRPLQDKYNSKLPEEAREALADLGKTFGDQRIADIRNKLAFHYSDNDNLVETQWRQIPESDPWNYYLSKLNVNSFFYVSEMVIKGVLGQLALPSTTRGSTGGSSENKMEVGFDEACKLNADVSDKILGVLGAFIAVIVDECLY
jgi:hypothetical protein